MHLRLLCSVFLLLLFLIASPAMAQDTSQSRDGVDPQALVAFNFTDRDIVDVIRYVVELTGWSVFYDPAQVTGKVTIVTPGKIPLEQAVRLLQGVMRRHGDAIQVLTPSRPHPVPLATVLAALSHPPESRQAVVWRNSNARGPQSRPYTCDQQSTTYSLLPSWIDVIVDQHR